MVAAPRGRTIRKLSKLAGLGVYRPAMLLDDDVVTDGQAKPHPLADGLPPEYKDGDLQQPFGK
jgi:hypothetical protein